MNIEPGTEEYRKIVRKKFTFDVAVIMLGGLLMVGAILLIKFGEPHSDPAKRLIAFIILGSGALSLVGILSTISLLLSVWAQTRLAQFKREKEQNKHDT